MRSIDEQAASEGPLGALFAEVLDRIEREGDGCLEQICRDHPEHAATLRRRLQTLRQLGLIATWTADQPPGRLGDFRIVARIGTGGMGVVYHAIQESLGRDVALKLIRPELLHLPSARERFAREITIVARLQHPGIVPIYTVGGADELPYYAMERVRGCTLAEALSEIDHDSPEGLSGADLARAVAVRSSATEEPTGALYSGTWEQVALRIVARVADALDHAHGRGVLHRDLKPSNVMLTLDGRVMLVDFGLSHSEGSDSVTHSGERAGSLPYMPPELLQQGLQAVDRRSDVYSLGVTLYQLLTLRRPFVAKSEPAVLSRILEGRPPPPRSIARGISWEAETVCLAAMERDPARRYATAADFAVDVESALQRRPIRARRASAWLRTRRWVQTRPAMATAIALALLAPTVIAVSKVYEVQRVTHAKELADEQRGLAQQNFERTLRAVDSMLVRVGNEKLDQVPGATELRADLLRDAAELYAELARERPDAIELAVYAVDCAHTRAGHVAKMGDTTAAIGIARDALPLLERGLARGDFDSRVRHANLLHFIGLWSEEPRDRAAHFAASLEELTELRRERPADLNVLQAISNSLSIAVINSRRLGDRSSAEALLAAGEQAAREMVAHDPANPAVQRLLGSTLVARGMWLTREGRLEESLAPHQEALALRRALLELTPGEALARNSMGESASALAGIFFALRRDREALELLEEADREAQCNLADFPELAEVYDRAADVAINLGAVYGALKREPEAQAATERAAELLGEILRRRPNDGDAHQQLGTTLINLASGQLKAGEPELAQETCARALAQFEEALSIHPDHPDYAAWLAPERNVRARVLLALDRTAEAAEVLADAPRLAAHRTDRAIESLRRMVKILETARSGGDQTTIERCEAAARIAIERGQERGDLEGDATLAKLRGLLSDV